jgi:hypothetical protein
VGDHGSKIVEMTLFMTMTWKRRKDSKDPPCRAYAHQPSVFLGRRHHAPSEAGFQRAKAVSVSSSK